MFSIRRIKYQNAKYRGVVIKCVNFRMFLTPVAYSRRNRPTQWAVCKYKIRHVGGKLIIPALSNSKQRKGGPERFREVSLVWKLLHSFALQQRGFYTMRFSVTKGLSNETVWLSTFSVIILTDKVIASFHCPLFPQNFLCLH